jgi:hypothetical protein
VNSKLDKAALGLIAVYVIVLIVAGSKVHVMETPGTAEMDGYADKADRILAGEIPRDPYHPLLYPILSAAAGRFAGGGFAGGRIVSSLCAGLLLGLTYLLGKSLYGRGAIGLLALGILLINYNIITMGMEAATDMTFAALAATVLFLSVRVGSTMSGRAAAGLGAVFGLALFTRYSAFFLLPAIVAAVTLPSAKVPVRRRAIASAWLAGAALIALIPHFILTERVFGTPWYSESWRNLALKMHGGYDWSYFRSVRYNGLIPTVLSSPRTFVLSFLREIARFLYGTIRQLGGGGVAGVLFMIGALAGLCAALFRMDRRKLIAVLFAGGYVALTCVFFYSGPRFMLPVLPVGCLWAGAAMLSGPMSRSFRLGRFLVPRSRPLIAIFAAVLVASTWGHMRAYAHAQPVRELEAARFIERTYGDGVTVLGTFPFMQRYVTYRYAELPDADASQAAHPDAYIDALRGDVIAWHADFILIGRLSLENRPPGLLSAERPPAFLEPVLREGDVVVYRVREEALE